MKASGFASKTLAL